MNRDSPTASGRSRAVALDAAPPRPALDPAPPRLVPDLLTAAAERTPAATAVRDVGGAWTYRELEAHSRRFAEWLRCLGVGAGDRVLVHHAPTRAVIAALYGTLSAGAVFVPVSPAVGDLRLLDLVADAEPAVVVTSDDGAGVLGDRPGVHVVTLTRVWSLIAAIAVPPARPVTRDPDDLALLLYTSGSTSRPKAVMCPHRQVLFATAAIAERLRYGATDTVFCRLPLSFDYGLYQALLCAHAGSELQLAPDRADVELLAWIRRWRATVIPLVPSLAAMLVRLARREAGTTTGVRLLTNTGEALPAELLRDLRSLLPDARMCLMFGVTECKRVSILEPDGDGTRPGSVGRPLPGTEVVVLDPSGQVAAAGLVGQFVVRGPHVAAGYWRAPELTADRFVRRPDGSVELHTGDYGYLDADGYLYFVGRRDDIFKRRGVRMSVREIEAAAAAIDGVAAAVVLPPDDGHDLTLFIVGRPATADVLRELRRRLEPAKVPAACTALPAFPLTANGKVDRRRLAAMRRASS